MLDERRKSAMGDAGATWIYGRGGEGQREREVSAMRQSMRARMRRGIGRRWRMAQRGRREGEADAAGLEVRRQRLTPNVSEDVVAVALGDEVYVKGI
jgi:hypothetical protein